MRSACLSLGVTSDAEAERIFSALKEGIEANHATATAPTSSSENRTQLGGTFE